MITREGFKTLGHFLTAVRTSLRRQVLDNLGVETWSSFYRSKLEARDVPFTPNPALVRVAANEILASVALNDNLDLDFFIDECSPTVKLSPTLLRPSVRLVQPDDPEGGAPRLDLVSMFKDGELSEALCTKEFFKLSIQRSYSARWAVVNFSTGCIDLSALETACQLETVFDDMRRLKTEYNDRMAGLSGVSVENEIGRTRTHHSAELTGASVLRMLSPYVGKPVLMHSDECENVLTWLGIESSDSKHIEDLQPSEQILAEFELNPTNKSEMKEILFPDMSGRQFDMHWRIASQVNPLLSTPGRKPRSE